MNMANDVKPGMSADDAAIEKIQFTPDWVGKISYWIFHYRKPLLILFILITILLGAMASQLRVQAAFTKFSSDLLGADKTYEAELLFGVTTDTGDAEGAVLQRRQPDFGHSELEAALLHFRGRISQIPPMYSALKRDGQPLYRLARQVVP